MHHRVGHDAAGTANHQHNPQRDADQRAKAQRDGDHNQRVMQRQQKLIAGNGGINKIKHG